VFRTSHATFVLDWETANSVVFSWTLSSMNKSGKFKMAVLNRKWIRQIDFLLFHTWEQRDSNGYTYVYGVAPYQWDMYLYHTTKLGGNRKRKIQDGGLHPYCYLVWEQSYNSLLATSWDTCTSAFTPSSWIFDYRFLLSAIELAILENIGAVGISILSCLQAETHALPALKAAILDFRLPLRRAVLGLVPLSCWISKMWEFLLKYRCNFEYGLRCTLSHIGFIAFKAEVHVSQLSHIYFRLMAAIFDIRHTQTSNSIPTSLSLLPNPQNIGVAVEISLLSCIEG